MTASYTITTPTSSNVSYTTVNGGSISTRSFPDRDSPSVVGGGGQRGVDPDDSGRERERVPAGFVGQKHLQVETVG